MADDYNQQEYYKAKGFEFDKYLDDAIHMPPGVVQGIVFRSRTFADVKRYLYDYVIEKPSSAAAYGLSKKSIDKFFEAYE